MRNWILVVSLCLSFSLTAEAQVEKDRKMREFLVSCTYGTLVGALVGAASLAFEDEPSEKLQHIARGASLGLYAGIALGIYVTNYYDPNKSEEGEDGLEPLPGEEPIPGVDVMYFEPMFKDRKLDGLKANFTLLQF